jgi:hypothetical protein
MLGMLMENEALWKAEQRLKQEMMVAKLEPMAAERD